MAAEEEHDLVLRLLVIHLEDFTITRKSLRESFHFILCLLIKQVKAI